MSKYKFTDKDKLYIKNVLILSLDEDIALTDKEGTIVSFQLKDFAEQLLRKGYMLTEQPFKDRAERIKLNNNNENR